MTSLKYILLGSAAVATAFAYTAMADHPHKPKKTESSEVETTLKKILGKKSDAKMAAVKSKSDKVDDANGADKKDDEKWDVMNPPGESREIDINVVIFIPCPSQAAKRPILPVEWLGKYSRVFPLMDHA